MLCTVPLIMVLGNSMLIPVLPDMGKEMGLTKAITGLAVTSSPSLRAWASHWPASWPTATGGKLVMVPSLLIYGLGGHRLRPGGWWLGPNGFMSSWRAGGSGPGRGRHRPGGHGLRG